MTEGEFVLGAPPPPRRADLGRRLFVSLSFRYLSPPSALGKRAGLQGSRCCQRAAHCSFVPPLSHFRGRAWPRSGGARVGRQDMATAAMCGGLSLVWTFRATATAAMSGGLSLD
jgi:hypothetical protein